MSWFLDVVFATKNRLRETSTTFSVIAEEKSDEEIFPWIAITIRSIPCWWTRSRHLYWLHYFHLVTPLCHMAIPMGYQFHCFETSVAFTVVFVQRLLIVAINNIFVLLSAMIKNLRCPQRMHLLNFTCKYLVPMEFQFYIVNMFQVFICWQSDLLINPLLTWLHWKEYYT